MADNSTKTKNDLLMNILNALKNLVFILSQAILEIYYGIKNRSLPYGPAIAWGVLFNLSVILKVDQKIFKMCGVDIIYPTTFFIFAVYSILGAFFGFILWGLIQAKRKVKMMDQLTQCFTNAGLKSATGKIPDFISDLPVDEFVRELIVTNAFQPLNKFKEVQNHIGSALKIYVDELTEKRANGTVHILYSHKQIPSMVQLGENIFQPKHQFIIGQTRIKMISSDLSQTPHLLIGGQTGGGKSTFLRSFITTLYKQNSNYEFILVDMKGGLEFQLFDNRDRITVLSNIKNVKDKLDSLDALLDERFLLLKENQCKDLEAFLKIDRDKIKVPKSVAGLRLKGMNRLVLVIDEAAELFLSSSRSTISDTQDMIRKVIRLAAQGRAVGIHLVIATQKPDSNAINTQIKANLTGILSFPMSTLGASMSILGNGRAKELPNIPGRAVWKNGLDQFEVQTPYISPDQVKLELDKISPLKSDEIV